MNPASPAAEVPSTRDIDRRANGVFYTPPRLAGLLATWILELDPIRILEPSYGQGVFLHELDAKLRERGSRNPGKRLFGVELDPSGPTHLRASGLRIPDAHLHSGDLLSLDSGKLGGRFDAIVGNPPYIRHQKLDPEMAARGRKSAQALGITLNGRSDAWTYFCVHLISLLADNGRLALVLPGSVLQADYAKPLLRTLTQDAGKVQLVRIAERLFAGVQERTVILLIDRSRPNPGPISYPRTTDLKGLRNTLARPPRTKPNLASPIVPAHAKIPLPLTAKQAATWEEVSSMDHVSRLGELAKVRIGVVTGANSFFLETSEAAELLGKRVRSVPVVSRGGWLRAPRWRSQDQDRIASKPSRLLLFPAHIEHLSKRAKAQIAAAEKANLHERYHCENRTPWYALTDVEIPDLFLPYMASKPTRLVINEARSTCTNAIHRVWLHEDHRHSAPSLALSSWTSLYRLSAELVGRSYGGGVLKIEPNGATALCVTDIGDATTLDELEQVFRSDGAEAAQRLADQRLLIQKLGLSAATVAVLKEAALSLQRMRLR